MPGKKLKKILLIVLLSGFINIYSAELSGGLSFGYNGGPGLMINGMAGNFAQNFPFKARLAFGYASITNPGKALGARRIFINNATNGKPEKQGRVWDIRMDMFYRTAIFGISDTYIFGGPRYTMFTGNFNFVDGNEDFDVTSNQWGWGLGLSKFFRMNKNFNLVFETGLEYFFESVLSGHDTSYSPDGEHVNPREDYSYKDADNAVNQPALGLRLLMGINYAF